MTSPGPDGLRIRQTRDATVIRVFPHRVPSPLWGVLVSTTAFGLWGSLRSWIPDGFVGLSVAVLVGALLAFVGVGLHSVRRAREILEVYVGKRRLHLIWSRQGATVREESIDLLGLEDAQPRGAGVDLLLEGRAPLFLPMAKHSDEARGWMVEHLRGAGLGAQRRFGHLPPDAGS